MDPTILSKILSYKNQNMNYETKQVLFWVDEKMKLEKWVMRIEFELWVINDA